MLTQALGVILVLTVELGFATAAGFPEGGWSGRGSEGVGYVGHKDVERRGSSR